MAHASQSDVAITSPAVHDNLPDRTQSQPQPDWSQSSKHQDALETLRGLQDQLNNLRTSLPAILYPLAYQTANTQDPSSTPAALYSTFREAAVRLKNDIHTLKATMERDQVKDVLRRVEEREEGLGNDGVLGDLEGPDGWELVVGRPRWALDDSGRDSKD